MDNEKIQRQMEFIIDQQAKFVVDIAKLDERLDRVDGQIERNNQTIERATQHILDLTDAMLSLTAFAQKHEGGIADLVKQSKETDAKLKETDERLNVLISIVESSIGRKN